MPISFDPQPFIFLIVRVCEYSIAMFFSLFKRTGIASPIEVCYMPLTFHLILPKEPTILKFVLTFKDPIALIRMIEK